jgi:signal transduction histidine kinase
MEVVVSSMASPALIGAICRRWRWRPGSVTRAETIGNRFGVLALARPVPTGSEAGVLTLLLASLAPAAAFGGIPRQARSEALSPDAARQAAAGELLAHAARGERARIARELHDVVAHHISMIAVQAETTRLTTSGMPAAGARRLTAIGDTARSALTEMRRLPRRTARGRGCRCARPPTAARSSTTQRTA